MKYSLKDQYRELLSETNFFDFYEDNSDLYYDEDVEEDLNDKKRIQIFPTYDAIAKNSNLTGKRFIYKIDNSDLSRLGNPGKISIEFDQVIEFGRLDKIQTSLKGEYSVLSSKTSSTTSILTIAFKSFFQAFEAIYLNRALTTSSDSISFRDENTKNKIKDLYKKTIKDFPSKIKKSDSQINRRNATYALLKSKYNSIDNVLGNKIEYIENNQEDFFFLNSGRESFFDVLYKFLLDKNDIVFSYEVENISNEDFSNVKKKELSSLILQYYTHENLISIIEYLDDIKVRQKVSNVEEVIKILNSSQFAKKTLAFNNANRIGPGEFICHLLFDTKNALLDVEPDVIFSFDKGKASVKSFRSKEAQTGTNMKKELKGALNDFYNLILKTEKTSKVSIGSWSSKKYPFNDLNNYIKQNDINIEKHNESPFTEIVLKAFFNKKIENDEIINASDSECVDAKKEIKKSWNKVKLNTIFEHEADIIVCVNEKSYPNDPFYVFKKDRIDINNDSGTDELDRVTLSSAANNRVNFRIDKDKKSKKDDTVTGIIRAITEGSSINKKENNVITEGGKAGHMMHPYENLHMKISDMKRMIEDFQNDFEISEKVDGANLFFTIDPQQGKILFSRNKSDMSHEETLEKFGPDHPAHVLFTDGANAIFNSVKNSLSKQDIQRVFGQSPEGGKTYINFEIMHPQKPNQIKYDMKYIVFHAIVDYDINGNVVESSPDDERLVHLLNQLQPSFNVENNDFSLGSNLKIKLNNLSQSDVDELLDELNSITSSLGLSDDMTISDAVKSEIRSLLDRENITELLPEDKIEMVYDFITNESTEIKGTAIKKGLDRELQKTLTSLGLTSKAKAHKIIKQVIQEFRPLFILLGIKLLDNVQSRYMSSDASNKNVDELRRLLDAAMEDYDNIMQAGDLGDSESKIFKSLTPHIANVRHHGVERVVSSPVEGGVFIGKDGNTYKVTGGFAPLNQILGTAMRSLDHMPTFKKEFVAQERGN